MSIESLPVPDDVKAGIRGAVEALKAYGAREVYVFGSAVTGRFHDDSDVDFAASGIPDAVFFRAMAQAHLRLHEAAHREMDLISVDDDTPFVRHLKEYKELVRVG